MCSTYKLLIRDRYIWVACSWQIHMNCSFVTDSYELLIRTPSCEMRSEYGCDRDIWIAYLLSTYSCLFVTDSYELLIRDKFIRIADSWQIHMNWCSSYICDTRVPQRIHMCDMTHSYVGHDSLICVTWLIHMCDMTHSYVKHDSFICVAWLIHVWHDSSMCVPSLIHMRDMTRSNVWHDAFVCVTWLIHMCDMTHSYMPLQLYSWHEMRGYRVARTHSMPRVASRFSQKSH